MHNLVRLEDNDVCLSRKPCKIRLRGRHFQGFCLLSLISGFLSIQLRSIDLRILFVRAPLAKGYFLLIKRCPQALH